MNPSRYMRYLWLAVFPAVTLTACGGGDDDTSGGDVSEADSAAIVDQMAAGMDQAMQGGGSVGPRLSTAELEARIPESVVGLQRTELTTMGMGAMNTTTARFAGDDDRTIEIGFVDAGAGAAGMAAGWTMATYNRTTADGFERTADFEGLKAFEKEERSDDSVSSELNVLAGNYVVMLRGEAVDIGTLRDIAEDLKLRELAP